MGGCYQWYSPRLCSWTTPLPYIYIYINDLPDVVHSFIKLFADDVKLYAVVNTARDATVVQNDLGSLDNWSEIWQINFNYDKCTHMQLGKDKEFSMYSMRQNGAPVIINKVTEEKDLRVTIDNKLKFVPNIQAMVKKANRNLGIIKRTFSYLDRTVFLNLYKTIVRPHLEYASTVWSVLYKKDCIFIENVQRRATRMVHSIRHLNFSDRLRELGLPSLQYKRVRADLIEVFKILNGIDKCDKNKLFQNQPNQRTRGHSQKLFKHQFRLDLRKHFFSERVIEDWNSLSENVISSNTINQFKNRLNKFWKNKPIKFEPDCNTYPLAHARQHQFNE